MDILTFRSPVKFSYCDYEEDEEQVICYNDLVKSNIVNRMRIRLEDDFDQPRFGSGLSKYLPDDMRKVILSVTLDFIEINEKVYTETVCITTRELNETELETLKEWITGQFSDGFGEGFEQHGFEMDRSDFGCYDRIETVYVNMWWRGQDWELNLFKSNRI